MLYINMSLGSAHGWGICGKYLSLELARIEPVRIISDTLSEAAIGDALEFNALHDLMLPDRDLIMFEKLNDSHVADGPLLQAIGTEKLIPINQQVRGKPNVGYTFFERNLLEASWIDNGRRYFDQVIAGSSWCAGVLHEAGLSGVATVIQGIDPLIFHPAAKMNGDREFLADKFVVFSGGKFEYRKGQDIVIRAYNVLQDRHPDVFLINTWHNPWPAVFETMRASRLIKFSMAKGSFTQVVNQILADNGIDLQRVITCPRQLNFAMARIYHNTDVGIFPNRCEGGTNLVLMEYMACGKPVIAVNTTGHADIVNSSNALVLNSQGDVTVADHDGTPVARWPEPDLADAIDKLEWAYQNRDQMRQLGCQAGRDLAKLTWKITAQNMRSIIHNTVGAN